MSQPVIFLGLIFLTPVEMPKDACPAEQASPFTPIPRYCRPASPTYKTWYPPAPGETGTMPATGVIRHTAQKVRQPGGPVIHPEVDTMEFRPSDALPGDAQSRTW